MSEREWVVPAEARGERLDRWLATRVPELSRSQIGKLLLDGQATVNGTAPSKAGQKLAGGEQIALTMPVAPDPEPQPEAITLDILYEDDDVVVINKAPGLVVHPAPGHSGGTLVNALLARFPTLNDPEQPGRPGIVHRLDRDTSGVLIVAKHAEARRHLQRQFRSRETEKSYLALVVGTPPTPRGSVEGSIGRHPSHRQRRAVVPDGRAALTHYETVTDFRDATLLRVHPVTGRTHQIRVHLSALGVPVAGDALYGPKRRRFLGLARHFLHAERLTITLPSGTKQTFYAPLPPDLTAVLSTLSTP